MGIKLSDLPEQEAMAGSDALAVAIGDKAGIITLNNLIESMRLNGVLPIILTQQEYDEKVQSGEISASDRKIYLIVNEQSG